MNRVGLKDYLLNHADDNDLLDCAKAWDAANRYGQFDTYSSVEEAAQANGWDATQALSEVRSVDQSADNFRLNGYAHLESVSKASLLEDARDNIDDIIDWLGNASRYDLEGISSDIELFVNAEDPLEIINEVDCSVRSHGDSIEVNLSRGQDKATLSFSKIDDIDADKIDLSNAAYAAVESYYKYADGHSAEEVQAKFRNEHGRGLSAERADQLTAACEKNMDALTQVLDDDEIEALDKLCDVELCSETYCATLANEAHECKYIASALEKMSFDVENGRAIEKHAELATKQRTVFDQMAGDDYREVHEQLGKFFGTGRVNQSEKNNVFPPELAYGKLFHGNETVADILYSGPAVDPIHLRRTFQNFGGASVIAEGITRHLAMLLSGSDVISTQSVAELLDIMADRFGIEPEERGLNIERARAEECIRTGMPDIQVEIDSTNDDNFIEGTVTVEGESCYFYRPNSTRSTEDYDSVVFEPFRPDGFEGDIEEIELPAAIDQNRELAELVVSVATEPYMDPDKAVGREQSIDSLCDEKTEVSESMRYGMEGVGLPMLDAAEHLMNY